MRRDGWQVRIRAWTCLTCDADNFYLRATLEAQENDPLQDVFTREWNETIPRVLL